MDENINDDVRLAEEEVSAILVESQTQALYRALVTARVEVARLQKQLAEIQQTDIAT